MRILHNGTLALAAGGPAMSTYHVLKGLQSLHQQAELIMFANQGKLIADDVPIHFAATPVEHRFAYSPKISGEIQRLGIFDIYHAQGVWQYPTYALATVARKNKKPYLISPRGMLYPQDIAKASTLFKKLSLKIRLLKDLNRAGCIHATCIEEMHHLRNLGVTAPIAVIPNPINIKECYPEKNDRVFRLGYLGRLSPRKNVESLLYAWKSLEHKTKDAELLIIGSDDKHYETFLKNEVTRLDIQNVRFTGFLSGEEKDVALASLSMLAMPSEFENFGNVILEGLIREIPCLATKGSPWEELITENCGWWVDYNQDSITTSIDEAMNFSSTELSQMGKNGKSLVEAKYSVESVAGQMLHVYQWLSRKSEKPANVFIEAKI